MQESLKKNLVVESINPEPVLSVTQTNQAARLLLERQFAQIAVLGEISGCKADAAGHCWFALKDEQSVLAVVVFRREARMFRQNLQNGQRVTAYGRLTIYPATGRYQLVASQISPQGIGARKLELEALTTRLRQEGLFAKERKRPLPLLPRRVAVLTSLQGAVLQDILKITQRRDPRAKLLVVPTKVQGVDCSQSVIQALTEIYALCLRLNIDVIVIARGGGSFEDLWGYQSEPLVRFVVQAPVPIVSAVGHETDVTLVDFAADQRAPTPSAAAELVFPLVSQLQENLQQGLLKHRQALTKKIQTLHLYLRMLRAKLGEATIVLYPFRQRAAIAGKRFEQLGYSWLKRQQQRLQRLQLDLQAVHPQIRLQKLRYQLRSAAQKLSVMQTLVRQKRARLLALNERLQALSPLAILSRGYSIALYHDQALRTATAVAPGDEITVRLASGMLQAQVTTTSLEIGK